MASPNALPVEAVVLADVAVVLAVSAVLVQLSRRFHQPPVVAEIAAGLMLGPSLLGLLPGHLPTHIFPAEARTPLSAIAQLGLSLFMFMAGWEIDPRRMRGSSKALGTVAVLSMAVPFAVGGGVAALLYGTQAPHGVSSEVFVLYLATAFSITAFPVLARIIRDQGLSQTRTGSMAMLCAAMCDVAAWCVLVLVTAIAGADVGGGFLTVLALTAGYTALMVLVVRPLLRVVLTRLHRREDRSVLMVLVVSGVLLSAWTTTWIGIHAIFGAFAFGLVMPRGPIGAELEKQLAPTLDRASALLLPVFFVITGLSTDVTRLGSDGLAVLGIALVAAVAGKFAGATFPARMLGMSWREAGLFGTLMNTRGLTEIVVLGIGRQLGLITANMFTVMVLVALITTAMAGPLIRRLHRPRPETPAATAEPVLAVRPEPAPLLPEPVLEAQPL